MENNETKKGIGTNFRYPVANTSSAPNQFSHTSLEVRKPIALSMLSRELPQSASLPALR